ncbi:MAG TPA: hypothetical protein VMW67_00570 [Desulfobacteria bacterium]|nr:hypothetical protein [Desulfobacteria bacterium]
MTKKLKRNFGISEEVANAKLALDLLRYTAKDRGLAELGYEPNELKGHLSRGRDLLIILKETLEMISDKKTGELDDAVADLVYSLKNLRETTNKMLLENLEEGIAELDSLGEDFSNINNITVSYDLFLYLNSAVSQLTFVTSDRLRRNLGAWTART